MANVFAVEKFESKEAFENQLLLYYDNRNEAVYKRGLYEITLKIAAS